MRARVAGAEKSSGRRLAGGAALLAASAVIAKIVGACYRVPLTNILGAEGIGLYQLVFPVFALMTTLSSAGIPSALARTVAEKRGAGESPAGALMSALALITCASLVCFLVTVLAARPIAAAQGNPEAWTGYVAVAPAVLFVGIVAGLRGWFQGELDMLPTALSNVMEQVVKLGAGVGFALALKDRGTVAAVAGALAGVTLSELAAAIYLAVLAAVRAKRGGIAPRDLRPGKGGIRIMARAAAPFAAAALIMPLGTFLDSFIIVNALRLGGVSPALATAQYGLYSGPVASLVTAPVVAIMSLAVAVMPSVSLSRAGRDLEGLVAKCRMSIKLVYLIGVPAALFFVIFGRDILGLLYPGLTGGEIALAGRLLSVQAVSVVLVSATQIYISLLQGLDRARSAVKALFLALIVKVVLSLTLTRFMGITGASVASVVMSAVSLAVLAVSFRRLTDIGEQKNIAKVLLAGVIMSAAGMLVKAYVPGGVAAVAAGLLPLILVYAPAVMAAGIFSEQELLSLPLGVRLVHLRRRLRFWD